MKRIIQITLLLLLSLTLIQCTSDDNKQDASLLVNGAEFRLDTNSSNHYPNIVASNNNYTLWLSFTEKTSDPADARTISVYAAHPEGTSTGTYQLSSSSIGPGLAVLSVMDHEGHQIAGGSDNQPTGTVSVIDYGNNKFKVSFNNVTLDPGTANETTISGSLVKTFEVTFTD